MDEIIYDILQRFTFHALSLHDPNLQNTIPDFNKRFQKMFAKLSIFCYDCYNILKSKSSTELNMIHLGLIQSNYNFLNSDPLHSKIVLALKSKMEEYNLLDFLLLNVEELHAKIEFYQEIIGYLAVRFNHKKYPQAKEFCLASFSCIIHETDCENWMIKLKYYVEEIKLTKLFVQGKKISRTLSEKLNGIPVIPLNDYGARKLQCFSCKEWLCPVLTVNYYFKKYHSFNTHYTCKKSN